MNLNREFCVDCGCDLKEVAPEQPQPLPTAAGATVEQMLERRHSLKLAWHEPRQACGPEGNLLDAQVELRATVHDCINLQREQVRRPGGETMGKDASHLLDFMANNFAQICPHETFP